MKKVLQSLTVALLVLSVVFSFGLGEKASAAGHSSSTGKTKIDTEKYSLEKHKKAEGIAVEKFNSGEKVSVFSAKQKFESYSKHINAKTKPSPSKDAGVMSGADYFFDHPDGFNGPGGKYTGMASGTSIPSVSTYWGNFKIASLQIASSSYVTLYLYDYYRGYSITFNNYSSSPLTINLTNYYMDNGSSWSGQVSSITSGNY